MFFASTTEHLGLLTIRQLLTNQGYTGTHNGRLDFRVKIGMNVKALVS
jgi:hypothetical protein